MTAAGAGWRLTVGKAWDAWRHYPADVRALLRTPRTPPILVTGTHRAGTTWVGAMLDDPGTWHVHEPFNPNQGLWERNFTYVRTGAHVPRVDRIMRRLLSGGLRRTLTGPRAGERWMPLRMLPPPVRPRRFLMKDPIACLMTAHLAGAHGLRAVAVFRHPGGFVASVRRLNWPVHPALRGLLEDEALMADWLQPHADAIRIACEGSYLAAATALHASLNKVLWGFSETCPGVHRVVFEELCADPIGRFQRLYETLGLPYSDAVRRKHERLCFAGPPGGDYRTHAVARQSREMADRWRRDLDAAEVRAVWETWNAFGIPLYQAAGDW